MTEEGETMSSTYESVEIAICVDCAMMVANGEGSPEWSEEETEKFLDDMDRMWPTSEGWAIVLEPDGDIEFSWKTCESCGSILGGTRMKATAMRSSGVAD